MWNETIRHSGAERCRCFISPFTKMNPHFASRWLAWCTSAYPVVVIHCISIRLPEGAQLRFGNGQTTKMHTKKKSNTRKDMCVLCVLCANIINNDKTKYTHINKDIKYKFFYCYIYFIIFIVFPFGSFQFPDLLLLCVILSLFCLCSW